MAPDPGLSFSLSESTKNSNFAQRPLRDISRYPSDILSIFSNQGEQSENGGLPGKNLSMPMSSQGFPGFQKQETKKQHPTEGQTRSAAQNTESIFSLNPLLSPEPSVADLMEWM